MVPWTPGATELDIDERLVVVGVSNTNRRLAPISAEGAGVSDTDRIIAMIRAAEEHGDRAIVAVDALIDHPAAAPIVRAVNAAVLVATLGRTMRRTWNGGSRPRARTASSGSSTDPAEMVGTQIGRWVDMKTLSPGSSLSGAMPKEPTCQ